MADLTLTSFHRVITAKFPDTHRLFTSEDSTVHYLAILNPDNPDMFVLFYVDENNESAVSIGILIGNIVEVFSPLIWPVQLLQYDSA